MLLPLARCRFLIKQCFVLDKANDHIPFSRYAGCRIQPPIDPRTDWVHIFSDTEVPYIKWHSIFLEPHALLCILVSRLLIIADTM